MVFFIYIKIPYKSVCKGIDTNDKYMYLYSVSFFTSCMIVMKKKNLPRIPRERTAIWVSSSPVGIADIKVAVIKVVWCCSGPIPTFRTLQQEIHQSQIYFNTIAILVVSEHTLKWPFISHWDQHHKHTTPDEKLYIFISSKVTLFYM